MSMRDEIVRILQSRGRVQGGTAEPEPDITNLRAAVGEVQDAVVRLAEEIDKMRDAATD
jgi:hypothetical protein